MDDTKFKRAMSVSASRILNISRCVIDDDITYDDFFKIMFILASLEEAKWDEEELRNKAKSFLESLSGTAKKELETAIEECQNMYLHYWDLIDKQNKKRNFKKNTGNGTTTSTPETNKTVTPVPTKKEEPKDDDEDFWMDGDCVAITPTAAQKIRKAGLKVEDVAGFIQANERILILPFDPCPIEEVIGMYEEQMKRQYPAAPGRGK